MEFTNKQVNHVSVRFQILPQTILEDAIYSLWRDTISSPYSFLPIPTLPRQDDLGQDTYSEDILIETIMIWGWSSGAEW